jgi:DNA-3-methyladenine glycosylase II
MGKKVRIQRFLQPQVTMQQTTLVPRPPFDFSLSAAIFSSGEPDIRTFRDGVFLQVLDTGTALVLAEVRSSGTTEDPKLALTLRSDRPVGKGMARRAGALVAAILSTADDMTPFYRAVAGDPVLADLCVRLRGVRAPVTPTVFEALVDSIIEQQISLKAARSIETRLVHATGKQLDLDGIVWYCYPDPEVLAGTADSTFRTCGLSARKGEYIRDISRLILKGELDMEGFRKYPDTEGIIGELVKVRGIGTWTAELTILRGLHRPDAFPADDVGVRRIISQFYLSGRKLSPGEARTFAERWGTWKGFAAYYLEVADLLGVRPTM